MMSKKWTINPIVVFDREFEEPLLKSLASSVIGQLNYYLKDIQLQYRFADTDFVSLATFLATYAGNTGDGIKEYNKKLIKWQEANPNTIRVEIDPFLSGFSGGANFSLGLGVVRLRRENWYGLLEPPESLPLKKETALGLRYKQGDVLMHELLHTLGVDHLLGALDYPKERRRQEISRETTPLMNPFITRQTYYLKQNDISAIYKLYGQPAFNKVSLISDILKGLNVAFIPKGLRTKRDIQKNFEGNFSKRYRQKLKDRAVAHGTQNGSVDFIIPNGKYIVEFRPNLEAQGTSGYEGDGLKPSFLSNMYLRRNKKKKCWELTDKVKKASFVKIKGNKEIIINGT